MTDTATPKPGRTLQLAAAAVLLVAGLMALWNVDNRYGTHCGSWISPYLVDAELADIKRDSDITDIEMQNAFLREAAGQRTYASNRPKETAQADSCRENRDARTTPITAVTVAGFAILGFAILRKRPTS